jgi:pyruvate dehydrogenase E1 component beta subunit
MPILSYLRALNRARGDEMERDPAVCVFGEDIGVAVSNVTTGLLKRYGPDRVIDMPISEQAFTSLATGAALAGARPVIEFQIPALLYLVFEQIANQAHKFSLMTGGQLHVPVTYLLPSSGSRTGWAGQHSDHPYSLFAHVGVKTVVPATPTDAYGLLLSAIRDDDPVILFAPAEAVRCCRSPARWIWRCSRAGRNCEPRSRRWPRRFELAVRLWGLTQRFAFGV